MGIDKKTVALSDRDPKRLYTPQDKAELILESRGSCSHPFCDYSYLTPQAHHIIEHSRGGLTIRPNGLILCPKCHRLLHDGLIPRQLALLFKYLIRTGRYELTPLSAISADELVARIRKIQFHDELNAGEKFHQINDIIIAANFLASLHSRYYVFINAIAAKVGILNDGISPLRSTYNNMLISMDARRKWAQLLAANCIKYARAINEHWITLYFFHSRAVAYNARNKFERAVEEFKRALSFYDSMIIPRNRLNEATQEKARLFREMAVCRAKICEGSSYAKSEVTNSLDISQAIGDVEDIVDGLNRCIETFLYCGELGHAEAYLNKIQQYLPKASLHSQAIAVKMNTKFLIAMNRIADSDDMAEKGLRFSIAHKFNQQIYHFSRLRWHIDSGVKDIRQRIIT